MDLKVPAHHSTLDWDFSSPLDWTLDPFIYVEAPSSLKFWHPTYGLNPSILCNKADTLNLPEGQISSWFRQSVITGRIRPVLYFRNQSPAGSSTSLNTYAFRQDRTGIELLKVVNGVWTKMGSRAITVVAGTWYARRVTWYNMPGALYIHIHYWNGSTWVELEPHYIDPAPSWDVSAQNRVGIGCWVTRTGEWNNFDETCIYGPP